MSFRRMVVIGIGLLACPVGAKEDHPLETQKDKLSYAMGVSMAKNIQRQAAEVDGDVLARGLRDGLSGKRLLMSEDEVRATMRDAMAEAKRKQREVATAKPDRKAAGEAFRAENAKKEGVVTLSSGVQYKVLKAGEGKRPTDTDVVQCLYRGTSIEGRELDSSSRRGKPARIRLVRAAPGWKEVLKLMSVGSTWQVVMPPERVPARGRKAKVARNETLVFEIQLLAIEPPRSVQAGEKTASALPAAQK
jgi:FKBP-type peptidyl-prolyl cis-trans isomerase